MTTARLASCRGRLLEWLTGSACPLWSTLGVDPQGGGFVEALDQEGRPLPAARRVRVQPRQLAAFTQAASLGWRGDARTLVRAGLAYLEGRYRREDGYFCALVSSKGVPLETRARLYDQAFVLLGYAAAAVALDDASSHERRALALRDRIERDWRFADGGFASGECEPHAHEANPQMHLLEACLAWQAIGHDPGWSGWVEELAELAVARLQDPASGAIAEIFSAAWGPAAAGAPQRIEPGHQFEWAWLLFHCRRRNWPARRAAALRLIEVGERNGVRNGVAVNALRPDLGIDDARARLWPQTERLKATLLAARLSGDERYRSLAADAAASLFPYLDTRVPGLWRDLRLETGEFAEGPAPASSFYHLVGAIEALNRERELPAT